jgi:hypothetical protein
MKNLFRLLAPIAATVLAAVAAIAAPASAAPASAAPTAVAKSPSVRDDCRSIGSSFTDKMIPGECITSGSNRLEMQFDGNLVLSNGSRVCWASGTNNTNGVFAVYSGDWALDSPYLKLDSPYGELRKYRGKYTGLHKTGNVSINDKGEVWIAYGMLAGC